MVNNEIVSFFQKNVLNTKVIKKEIGSYLQFGHQRNTKVELYPFIKAILYQLKTSTAVMMRHEKEATGRASSTKLTPQKSVSTWLQI